MSDVGNGSLDGWIPQCGAMRLLDRVLEVDDQGAVAEVDVPADGLFVHDGQVAPWIGLEYMAQTISAWAGGRSRRRGGGAKLGLLLGSRRYHAPHGGFPCGATLRVEARCEFIGSNGLGLFDCRIAMVEPANPAGRELATAQVTVFEPEDAMAFFASGETA